MAEFHPPEGLRQIIERAIANPAEFVEDEPYGTVAKWQSYAVLAALFEACEVREEWGVRWYWPDGPEMATGGFLGPRADAERWLLDPPSNASRGELVHRYKIFTPAEPVSSTGEEPTDG